MKSMDIPYILGEYNINPLRGKDQFFLSDEKILDEEISLAELSADDKVLEIGAGVGNLTRKIAEKCSVIAIESDKRFLPLLRKIENSDIVFGDALRALEEKRKGLQDFRFNKIISNIPYGISQPLLIELLQHEWDLAVLCVQRAFAEKLWKKEAVALATQQCCDFDIVRFVPADAFYPESVESAIIVLQQKALLEQAFWIFLKKAYAKRNRNARNVFRDAPASLAHKKIHQLSAAELKELWSMNG